MAGSDALPHIQRLLAAARAARTTIFYSTDANIDGTAMVGWATSQRGAHRAPAPSAEMACRRRRMNEIVDEVAPLPGELVFTKASPSVFWGTPLISQLTAHGIDTVALPARARAAAFARPSSTAPRIASA